MLLRCYWRPFTDSTEAKHSAVMAEMRHNRQQQQQQEAEIAEKRERSSISPLHSSPSSSAPNTPLLSSKQERPLQNPFLYQAFFAFVAVFLLLVIFSPSSVWDLINPPFLCQKDGIYLRCPPVRETPSLWENPYSATTSWKPCADRKSSWVPPAENETNGYLAVHAEGGLNQQRIAICNAVAVAKIMNVTLIIPLMKQDQIWKDQTRFEDVFDVDLFINYLKDDVRIVKEIPSWFTEKAELYTSIRRTVKNIPKYASAQFYLDNVLPRIKEKRIMALKPFVDRLGYDNVPPEINMLRCKVNYHALKFLPEVEEMADVLIARMRNRTSILHPYMALHLRFEKGMVGLSFCDFVGNRHEKAMMAAYRQKEWPRRYKNAEHSMRERSPRCIGGEAY
ncbi:hypothetical protein KP509_14G069100 [Ceratopteris richardii]|uniref:O-fucosyltransferase family protein n=1 Tax=Ceratopteris richardii TaxID=49495 RepID=A0A8T2TG17_CERRI|nr:hypothetical protein KP509_14G069100 [Ceratopteris richardii]